MVQTKTIKKLLWSSNNLLLCTAGYDDVTDRGETKQYLPCPTVLTRTRKASACQSRDWTDP